MSIISKFSEIIHANVNAALDKMEDPSKMIDQYLREMNDNLAQVKKETAGVMAEETRTKRLVDANRTEVTKYENLAKEALRAGNEDDARVFLTKKQELETTSAGLATAYASAHENAIKMRQMHDKLVADIETLQTRCASIKAKTAVAKTQETINKVGSASKKVSGAMSAFDRMEEKANRMMDEANAMADLNTASVDAAKELEKKYKDGTLSESVDAELESLKKFLEK